MLVDRQASPGNPPPSLHPHYRASPLLRGGPSSCPASVRCPSQFPLLGGLPLADHANTRPALSGRGVPTFRTGACTGLAPPLCRTPPGQSAGTRQAHPRATTGPWFRCRRYAFDTSTVVHSRSPSRLPPDTSRAPFPQRSPPRLIHQSSLRWFGTSPCRAIPEGPPPSPAQHRIRTIRPSTSNPPSAFVAHGRPRTGNADTASREIRSSPRPSTKTRLLCHPILCRMRLDHPDDHPDDPSRSVGSRLDRRGTQREQARPVWSRPGLRRASVS